MTAKSKKEIMKSSRAEIERLFALAKKNASEQRLAQRYVTLARKIGERNRISLRQYNRVHCRQCCAYWTSKTLRVRTRPTAVVYTCLSCGNIKRVPKK